MLNYIVYILIIIILIFVCVVAFKSIIIGIEAKKKQNKDYDKYRNKKNNK